MHFNKFGCSDNNNLNILTSSSATHFTASASASGSGSALSSSLLKSSSTTKAKNATHGLNLGLWWLLFVAVVLMAQQQPCECRYLPTRSHGDDLDKLRELMLQILESSNEDGGGLQRAPAEANGNNFAAAAAAAQRANWLNKLGGNMDSMDVPRKYNGPRAMYDNAHYY